MQFQKNISKKDDLVACFGGTLAAMVLGLRADGMTRLPQSVTFTDVKPAFYLDDGSTLKAYGIDLQAGSILNSLYCGSADTAMNHQVAQLGEGFRAPQDSAVMFVESYWNGRNMSWALTVVSPNITGQIENK